MQHREGNGQPIAVSLMTKMTTAGRPILGRICCWLQYIIPLLILLWLGGRGIWAIVRGLTLLHVIQIEETRFDLLGGIFWIIWGLTFASHLFGNLAAALLFAASRLGVLPNGPQAREIDAGKRRIGKEQREEGGQRS